MTQRQFERALRKVCPNVRLISYNKKLIGKDFKITYMYIHWNDPNLGNCQSFQSFESALEYKYEPRTP